MLTQAAFRFKAKGYLCCLTRVESFFLLVESFFAGFVFFFFDVSVCIVFVLLTVSCAYTLANVIAAKAIMLISFFMGFFNLVSTIYTYWCQTAKKYIISF